MTKTIMDGSSIRGLLRIAGNEGMLEDKENYGDRFLYSLRNIPLQNWHRQQIIEQVILNDRILYADNIPLDWLKGDFLGMNLIEKSSIKEANEDIIESISPELIEGMLLARGYHADLIGWCTVLERAISVYNEVDQYEKKFPGVKFDGLYHFFRGISDTKYRLTDQYKLASKLNEAVNKVAPFSKIVEELVLIVNHASQNSHYLRVPIYRPSANLINIPATQHFGGEATYIFRITTQQLGSIPFCDTLQNALKLAKRPETIALRAKIFEWVNSIDHSSVDITAKIQREIKEASRIMTKASRFKSAGLVSAIISVPVSAVGIINPFFGALGLSLTCIGIICDRSGAGLEKSVNWIGFGSGNS